MELQRARSLLDAERARVLPLLADVGAAQAGDRQAEGETGDATDVAQPLAEEGVDDAVAAELRNRLAALDRALQRIDDGTYGRSIRSGVVIPVAGRVGEHVVTGEPRRTEREHSRRRVVHGLDHDVEVDLLRHGGIRPRGRGVVGAS